MKKTIEGKIKTLQEFISKAEKGGGLAHRYIYGEFYGLNWILDQLNAGKSVAEVYCKLHGVQKRSLYEDLKLNTDPDSKKFCAGFECEYLYDEARRMESAEKDFLKKGLFIEIYPDNHAEIPGGPHWISQIHSPAYLAWLKKIKKTYPAQIKLKK